jgi:two-component system, cell cycle sensor histidine kinase and response regulator CckA
MVIQPSTAESGRVLLIEHDANDARLVVTALSEVSPFDFEIDFATDLPEAELLLEMSSFDLILLDIEQPELAEEETVRRLVAHLDGGALIVLAPLGMEGRALELLGAGAADYVVKRTLRKAELGRSIRYALERQQLLREASVREERLRAAIEAQKIWVVGRLAAGVSHEFSNLVTGLLGDAGTLLKRVSVSDPNRHTVEELARGLERATLLTRQLISFSRKRSDNKRTIDLNMVISSMTPMMESLLGARIRLEVRCCRQPARVSAGPSHVEQLILNLVTNARDAIPHGGTVYLETALVQRRSGRFALLTVRDDGIGMEAHNVSRVFEPYFTTKGERGRVGLGLAAVSHIVEHNEGHAEVDSELGKGTEFRILLPALEAEFEQAVDDSGPHATVRARARSVLVVEDSEPVRRLIEQALAEVGYDVSSAADGSEALAIARGLDHELDLLITDIVVPHLNGRDLADELARRFLGMKTLFISGYDEEILAPEGTLEAGVNFLPKPFHLREVLCLVRQLLGE